MASFLREVSALNALLAPSFALEMDLALSSFPFIIAHGTHRDCSDLNGWNASLQSLHFLGFSGEIVNHLANFTAEAL